MKSLNNIKLWSKGFDSDKSVELFTVGRDRELDLKLAKFDVTASMAHIRMLQSIGLLEKSELEILLKEMEAILTVIENGDFEIENGVEDVHSQIELMLTRKLGEVGKKIHSGRSRNDQVLVDLKLFFKAEIKDISLIVKQLFDTLINLSEANKDVLMPGYTHFQIAMPSSFGLWFGAYAESLTDDVLLLEAAYKHANQNPLGSAAGYGSSFPLNRTMTTELLGFETMHFNSVAAQMSRGKTERTLGSAVAAIAGTLSKLSGDICLYTSQNFGFVSFPDELTTGSSIMPHKKNPDMFELIRGKCNRLQALPNELILVTSNLPSGYHRDFQLLKEIIFPAIDELKNCLTMCNYMLQNIRINTSITDNPLYDYLFTVEDVNRKVLSGIPFRDAYREIGAQVQEKTYKPNREINHTHEGSIGNLCNDKIKEKMEKRLRELGIKNE
ncbi:MAG: argininosuccinate lyase [Prevotellaceae bacterium]|jgi:argininosuccinate lyase|nr:argininosuccinate lyase [Prevotellaceae bacterium]